MIARVRAQAGFEVRAVLRNGEQLLLTVVLPVLALAGLVATPLLADARADRLAIAVPSVLALAVMGTAFTSQAIATAVDRRSGVLRLLATTPLGPSGLLAGKAVAVATVIAGQVVLLGGAGALLGWRPAWSGLPLALAAVVLGAVAFTALALVVAGRLRLEGVLALSNLALVLLAVGGGVLVPPDRLPAPLAALAPWNPAGALADALRGALGVAATAPALPTAAALGVLAAWAAGLTWLATRTFRWH